MTFYDVINLEPWIPMKLSGWAYVLLIVVLCGRMPALANAAEVSVIATVDKTAATMQDSILLTVSVQGTRSQPSLAGLDDFRVSSRGSSSQVRIINGAMSSSYDYNYLLQPLKPGNFTIGPCAVVHKKTTYASNTIALTISKQAARSADAGRDVFITAEIDNPNPYVHEQVHYTLKFFSRVQVGNARLSVVPDFEGFVSERLGKEREYTTVLNGQTYSVTELCWVLFPVRSGVLTIGESVLDCERIVRDRRGRGGLFNDPFFDDSLFAFGARTEPKSLRTEPLTVMAQSLPTAGRPAGFSQLVGEFDLSGTLSESTVHAGDSATLTLVLRGNGNLHSVKTIALPALPTVKVYDDKPVLEADQSRKRSERTLTAKKALVPVEKGDLRIPPVDVVYFNPALKKYMTARTGPFSLTVLPARQAETLQAVVPGPVAAAKEDVKVLGRDILPVYTGPALLERAAEPRLSAVHCMLLAAPACLYILVVGIYSARMRLRSDSTRMRARSAWPKLTKRLASLRATAAGGSVDFYGEAGRALRDFAGDKLGFAGSALTPPEIRSLLERAGVDAALIVRIVSVLEQCDAGRYGSVARNFAAQQELLKELTCAARELHRSF